MLRRLLRPQPGPKEAGWLSPTCMHLCQEPQPVGLAAGRGRACPLASARPWRAVPSAGFSQPALSPLWGQGCEGSQPPATAPLLPSHKVLGSAKQVQATEWPRGGGVCGEPAPPQGRCCQAWVPADTAPQACRSTATAASVLEPSSHATFPAEALSLPPGAERPGCAPRAALPLSWESTAGMSRKNVPVDMYIPQCCNFVCSNHVNTCMDFIIYILYVNL